jgi:hypothetical protein
LLSRSDFTSLPFEHDAELDFVEDVEVAARDTVGGDGGRPCRDVTLLLRLGHAITVPARAVSERCVSVVRGAVCAP